MNWRSWRDLISAVVVFLVMPPVLLWWALTAGLVWPFNDNYYDPHTEISKSYHRHPDAFHDAAYHLLAQVQEHPNALRARSRATHGTATWYLDTIDPKTGEQAKEKTPPGWAPPIRGHLWGTRRAFTSRGLVSHPPRVRLFLLRFEYA